ncbi:MULTISPECIES: ABC transporter ATP-binding protein [Paraburkholderia]|uniref:NitT/TauT family transport system ATP-binding protein n=1 Tax=Paraburkholderia tuberum TaxID=157910 RepID=A0A1H1HDX6_9BURK|nr:MULTISPECIES: ABC transporter ATP-binding protein [Paraburkholderia]MBB5412771.1 NitT/TauT family transport system ATP-binding protein [Paraburkholderia sp. HC6.4b]MBB5454836.1 NitT/TauT family transport system ATP-binding protein [Paraburkholderia sp. Kb1A]MBB5463415.1 NitT/TauT family transport system ATP-binding protein [Paraburkholderia sp. Cpub6]MBB5470828.1 NitT/TauT family transport system ATP-binding protein [Paraburkholderia sp. CI2]MBB5495970.1 NitT/TauT family transport system AT
MSMIRFNDVSRMFRRDKASVVALEHVELEIADKEFVAIVGPSGCGKTTCLRMVAGLEFPTSGSVTVAGRKVTRPGPDRAVVFQQFALFPWKTVWDNIDLGLRAKGMAADARRETIERYLSLMNLRGYEQAYPHQLSGGMQQRVAIARAYALDPGVLLMDEPFGALDAQTRVVMQEELVRLTRVNPRTVLFITHAVEESVYLADRVVVMTGRPGRVKEVIDVKSVREQHGWDACKRIEDVMDLESFVRLRTHIWKSLRDEHGAVERVAA